MMRDRHGFAIRCIGPAARSCVANGRRGSVLAVFHRSFYAALDDDDLICVGPEGMGAGPLNALASLPDGLDWQASGLTPGDGVRIQGGILKVGRTFEFAFQSAADWQPAVLEPVALTRDLAAGVAALQREAGRYDLSEGLASLVMNEDSLGGPLLERGRSGVAALREWMADTGPKGKLPSAAVRDLVGLGPGLTPSGDDLIGGAMIALHAFGRSDLGTGLAGWVLPIAKSRTGRISLAHLSCAADGLGAAALHRAISGAAQNSADAIAAALADLDRIGHSSGWDALVGVVTAMSAMKLEAG